MKLRDPDSFAVEQALEQRAAARALLAHRNAQASARELRHRLELAGIAARHQQPLLAAGPRDERDVPAGEARRRDMAVEVGEVRSRDVQQGRAGLAREEPLDAVAAPRREEGQAAA